MLGLTVIFINALYLKSSTSFAALISGLSNIPIEYVWIGYCRPSSLAILHTSEATKLESRPPIKYNSMFMSKL